MADEDRPPCGAAETFLNAAGDLTAGLLLAWWAELMLAAAVCWWMGWY